MDFTIRSAEADDLVALRAVYRRASLGNEHDRDVLLRHPEALVWSEDGIATGRTRVAAVGSRVVGFASVEVSDAVAELEDLFVDPDFQRRGIASVLVEDAVSWARQAGFDRLEVTANPHAAEFYAGAGFAWIADTETEFGSAPRLSRATAAAGSPS